MAEELWNRVNIAFPGAVSSVRINFTSETNERVQNVLMRNKTALDLIDSEILQTEIRVLYELLYLLNNSYRGNKSYKGLQQVEQCVNRLKTMKLVEALYEFIELCPNKIQRKVGEKTGECAVPSQPMLEWLCLKVLGAAHLMNCTLQRCTRAFLLCNQQMKWGEFIVLNMVITSMLSRLWVIFRGVLVSLSTLYESILNLCREVAEAKPMPFVMASSLPPNMSEILNPALLRDQTCEGGDKKQKRRTQMGEALSKTRQRMCRTAQKVNEDLGISVKRDKIDNSDLKPYVNMFKTFTKKSHPEQKPKNNAVESQKQSLKSLVKKATSFGDICFKLNEIVHCFKWNKMAKERHLFNCLRLKCQRMKGLETEGYNVQKKLDKFKIEVLRACSNELTRAASMKKVQLKINFHTLRSRFKSNNIKTRLKKKLQLKKKWGKSKSRRRRKDNGRWTEDEAIPQSSHCDSRDDIDDIFASIGL